MKGPSKQFGRLTLGELRAVYAHSFGLKEGLADLPDQVSGSGRRHDVSAAIQRAGGWGSLYALPVTRFLAVVLWAFDALDDLLLCAETANPQGATIEFLESFEIPDIEEGDLEHEAYGVFLSLVCAVTGNAQSLLQYGEFLNDLVQRVGEGDDDALFRAIRIDPLAIQAWPIAGRIGMAHLLDDRAFLDKLGKAITRTKPIRPKAQYDDLRLALALLEEARGLDQMSADELDCLLIDCLELYPDTGRDAVAGLRAHIRKHPRKSRK